jgi:hypothetical protein
LRGSAGVTKQRWRRKEATRRRWRGSGCAKIAPVSADWTKQRKRGHTEGCLEQLTVRRSSPWHGTGRGRDGGRRTGSGRRQRVAELLSRAQSEREGERIWQRAQMSEERWVSRARGSKGERVCGRGRRTRGRGSVHDGEIVGERLGTTDRWGRRDRERERERGGKRTVPTARPHREARGRGGVSALGLAPTGGARLSGTECARAGLSGPVWAEIGFPLSRDFLISFLFIFSRVFNSNSTQVSNSNQIKYMQQFKEYLGSI